MPGCRQQLEESPKMLHTILVPRRALLDCSSSPCPLLCPSYGLNTPASHTLVVGPWLLLKDQWEGFTQASQLQGLALATYHQPRPSIKDQLCRGRVVVL